MKSRHLAVTALLLPFAAVLAASPPETGWEPVDAVFGSAGKDLPGNVRRYGWPRTDLRVTIGSVPVEPGLALGAWAGFMKTPGGSEAITMGDLVVLESELALRCWASSSPVASRSSPFTITWPAKIRTSCMCTFTATEIPRHSRRR
jgi:Domain of Unknown Function (DUF1259)